MRQIFYLMYIHYIHNTEKYRVRLLNHFCQTPIPQSVLRLTRTVDLHFKLPYQFLPIFLVFVVLEPMANNTMLTHDSELDLVFELILTLNPNPKKNSIFQT